MSGHSKWATTKRQKAAVDAKRSSVFTKIANIITIAARQGGNPEMNFSLRIAVDRARAVNMPKDNIERAIARAAGGDASVIESVVYEGYGPAGVGLLIEAATDNRQRTVSGVKQVLERAGGRLATPGAVGYQFKRAGVITISKIGRSFDQLMGEAVEAGADDVVETDDMFEVYTKAPDLSRVALALRQKGLVADNTELIMRPIVKADVGEQDRSHVENLVEKLEALEDVQHVYSNVA